MPIYEFWWGSGSNEESFLMEIDAPYEVVKKLLEEYKESDEFYDNLGWCEFLEEKGIKATIIEPEYSIYF